MSTYVLGLDLGQRSDRTALSIVEDISSPSEPFEVACKYLQTWSPGTHYTKVLNDTLEILGKLAQPHRRRRATPAQQLWVGLDVTVAGPTAEELFEASLTPLGVPLTAITITSGIDVVRESPWRVKIPKRDLASLLRVLLETEKLHVAGALHHGADLQKEMQNFKAEKIASENTIDWRTREHDDLVLATALACWLHKYGSRAASAYMVYDAAEGKPWTISPY